MGYCPMGWFCQVWGCGRRAVHVIISGWFVRRVCERHASRFEGKRRTLTEAEREARRARVLRAFEEGRTISFDDFLAARGR